MENYWNISEKDDLSKFPNELAGEQCENLGKATENYVTARLREVMRDERLDIPVGPIDKMDFNFGYEMILETKYLPNYSLRLLTIYFNIPVYPIYIKCNLEIENELNLKSTTIVGDENEYLSVLKSVLGSKYTGKVITTLRRLSKSKEHDMPF